MTTCIPRAQGVPGLNTAPNWFDAGAGAPPRRDHDPALWTGKIEDPRWVGAYNRGFGFGTAMEAQFRGLYMDPDWRGKKSLFLSWQILYDGSLNNGLDRLYVGFNNGGAGDTDSLILKIVAYNDSSADIVAGVPGSVQALNLDAATGEGLPLANPPNWLSDTRVWLKRTPIGWVVQMYVPYAPGIGTLYDNTGINLPDPFRFFYQIYVLTPTRVGGSNAFGGFVTQKWPLASANVFSGLTADIYPHPAATAWDEFHPSTGAGDPMCPTTGGVSIDYSGLGNMVDGGAPNIIIKYSQTLPQPVNTLFANVDNQTGASIPAGGITARFRIADWGSVIMDPSAPWTDVRGGGAVTNAVPIPTGKPTVTAGNPPPLNFNWTLNAVEIAPYLSGKPSDQCILVELQGAGITFFNDSARQNHLIQPASVITKKAQISIEGLAPIPGGGPQRDVYLAVETRNMPTRRDGDTVGTPVWNRETLAVLRQRDINSKALAVLEKEGLLAALSTGVLDLQSLVDLQPTYTVHVYHDTGKHLTVDSVDYPILEPQTSFGMMPDHVGPIVGWDHGLTFPAGALQEEIAPGFYRVHVPNNGKIDTTVKIHAVEPGDVIPVPPGSKKWPWWLWLLLLLLLLLILMMVN